MFRRPPDDSAPPLNILGSLIVHPTCMRSECDELRRLQIAKIDRPAQWRQILTTLAVSNLVGRLRASLLPAVSGTGASFGAQSSVCIGRFGRITRRCDGGWLLRRTVRLCYPRLTWDLPESRGASVEIHFCMVLMQCGKCDDNASHRRREWRRSQVQMATRALADRDARAFMRQSASTPCL